MPFSWEQMTADEFAEFERLLGSKVVGINHVYWRRVRPCFYRPLLQFQAYRPDSIVAPPAARFGGFQHAVPPEDRANSLLNRLAFDQVSDYSLDSLDHNRKRQVKLSSREFVIRRIEDVAEFKQKAHPPYLSFYTRTRYPVGSKRRHPDYFERWADALFRLPKVLVLGGYRDGELGGVSLSFLVEHTLIYATFFCHDEALRMFLSDLMLHAIRESAAVCANVERIFLGMYKGAGGVDGFYQLRGATLIRQRASLQLNPLARALLRCCMPRQYAGLLGTLSDGPKGPIARANPLP